MIKGIDFIFQCVYTVYIKYIQYIRGRGEIMNIIISNTSGVPIYEQISKAIRNEIINGYFKEDDILPSIRSLASELRVSVITTKRAYEELEKEGFIKTVAGKGTFVSEGNSDRLKEAAICEIESKLDDAISQAKAIGLTLDECIEIFKSLFLEE